MNQSFSERARARRAVRKANRIARVDTQQPHRRRIAVFLVLLVVLFVVGEVFLIDHAKDTYHQHRSEEVALVATEQLNLISAALIAGDQTRLDSSIEEFDKSLDELNRNPYMQHNQADLLARLNDYSAHIHDKATVSEFLRMRLAVLMLDSELSNIDLNKVSVETVSDVRIAYQNFDESISKLDGEELASTITTLKSYDKEIMDITNKFSACVGACKEKTIAKHQTKLAEIFEKHRSLLQAADADLSKLYDPTPLCQALSMLE